MKHIICCILFFAIALIIEAQILPERISNEEHVWFRVGTGQRYLNTTKGNITTYFEADPGSAVDDRIHKEIHSIRNNLVRQDFQAEVGYTHSFGLSHALMLDICAENNFAFAGGYSLGWEFPLSNKENFIVRPAFAFLLSNAKYNIGQLDINGNPAYYGNETIEIGGNRYFTQSFDIYLSQDKLSLLYGPQLHLNFLVKNSAMGWHCSAGYFFNKNLGNSIVIFDPGDFADNEQITAVSTNSSRLNVVYNEVVFIDNSPFHFGGFSVVLGITFNL